MLLFPQKAGATIDATSRKFYVLSARSGMSEQLCEQFRMAGINAVNTLHQDFHQEGLSIPTNANGVVVDIGASEQIDEIVQSIQMQIPRDVWCCLVGDSDSISLAQAFARNNINYFSIHAQQDVMVQAAVSGIELKANRQPVSISVLGCKGGVGTSTIGYQLSNEIARIKQMPTLFIHGAHGSQDLDLIAGMKLTHEITMGGKQLDLMNSQSEQLPNLNQADLQKYNFVVFEQSIITADKELQRHLVESSLCLILVMDRSMASVRVARNMIENLQLLQRTSQASRRLFLCINDSRPVAANALTPEDIKSILNRPVDLIFPYNKQKNTAQIKRLPFSRKISPMDELTHYVLGGATNPKASRKNQLRLRSGKVS